MTEETSASIKIILSHLSIIDIFTGFDAYGVDSGPKHYAIINGQAAYDPRSDKLKIDGIECDISGWSAQIRAVSTWEDFEKSQARRGHIMICMLQGQFYHLIQVLQAGEAPSLLVSMTTSSISNLPEITRLKFLEMALTRPIETEPKFAALNVRRVELLLALTVGVLIAICIRMS